MLLFYKLFGITAYAANTVAGTIVNNLWNTAFTSIKEVAGPLAIATFVCSGFYFFILGKGQKGLDTAKGLMIGSAVGIVIIYLGPTIVNAIINTAGAVADGTYKTEALPLIRNFL